MSNNAATTTGLKGKNVGKYMTGTREEWLAARLDLLKAEKELTRRSDEVALQRQQLPWVRIEKGYRFETDEGSASLADLFKGRSQLLVYHFMFGADYKAGCPNCSSIADGFNGNVVHLENHDVSFYAISRAPLEKLQAYKRRLGWTFPWASSLGGDFNSDLNVSFSTFTRERPGMSAFAMEDGVVYHTYSAFARGLDALWGVYQWLDRAPLGRNETTGTWFRRNDEYKKG